MKLKTRLDLLLHKDECIRAIIFNEDKRGTIYIKRVHNIEFFDIGDCTYNVRLDHAFYMGGLPTFVYFHDNPEPIDPETSRAEKITASLFNATVKQNITKEIFRLTKEPKSKLSLGEILSIINIMGTAIVGYLVYSGFEKVNLFFEENGSIIELIKDLLLQGGFN